MPNNLTKVNHIAKFNQTLNLYKCSVLNQNPYKRICSTANHMKNCLYETLALFIFVIIIFCFSLRA